MVTAAAASLSAVASSTLPHSLTVSVARATRPSNQSVAMARPISPNIGPTGPPSYTRTAIGATRRARSRLSAFAAVHSRPMSGKPGAGGRRSGVGIGARVAHGSQHTRAPGCGAILERSPTPRVPSTFLLVLLVAFAVNVLAWGWVAVGWRRMVDALDADDLLPRDARGARLGAGHLVLGRRRGARRGAAASGSAPGAAPADAPRRADEPLFEVVVVNDRSADDTEALLRKTAAAWRAGGGPDLRVVQIEPGTESDLPPKKRALAAGIAQARFDRLALTDADTDPPAAWLDTLARYAAPQSEDDGAVLIGFGPYARRPGWINRFVRYETIQTAALAAAGVGWNRPWQAVGRNLSYTRSLFERLGGFASSAASLSGDDDLFVQRVAQARTAEVRYVLDSAAFVPSEAPSGWNEFWRQRRRHASAGAHYAPGVLVGLGVLHVSALVLWLGAPLYHLASGQPTGWGVARPPSAGPARRARSGVRRAGRRGRPAAGAASAGRTGNALPGRCSHSRRAAGTEALVTRASVRRGAHPQRPDGDAPCHRRNARVNEVASA